MDVDESPKIRFNGNWMPAHLVWEKFQTILVAADTIERFNERWSSLATDATRAIVPKVRKQLKAIELIMPSHRGALPDLGKAAVKFLEEFNPEETIERMQEEFGQELDLQSLVTLVGIPAYLKSLVREAYEFRRNKVSLEQTATLWNELGRPASEGGKWTAAKVDQLINSALTSFSE